VVLVVLVVLADSLVDSLVLVVLVDSLVDSLVPVVLVVLLPLITSPLSRILTKQPTFCPFKQTNKKKKNTFFETKKKKTTFFFGFHDL
jgi:bifunctional pyridoxal-dependent enzyme with beta-cystathionase and maltose regulon repressor activities